MCSKHFHHKRIGKENLTLPLPLRTNIVWRQLWIDTPLRHHIENDKSWLKSSWGKRIQQPTAKANTSTKQHPKRKQKQSRATSQPASKPTVFPLHFEDSKITWRNTFRAAIINVMLQKLSIILPVKKDNSFQKVMSVGPLDIQCKKVWKHQTSILKMQRDGNYSL